jgi:hypothetical protein
MGERVRLSVLAAAAIALLATQGCAAVGVANAAIGATGAVVGGAAKVAGTAVGVTADAVGAAGRAATGSKAH